MIHYEEALYQVYIHFSSGHFHRAVIDRKYRPGERRTAYGHKEDMEADEREVARPGRPSSR